MKRFILLYLCFSVFPAFSAEEKALFIPREDHPFQKFSPGGDFSIQPGGEKWPEVLQIVTPGDGSNVQLVAQDLPEYSLTEANQILWVKVNGLDHLKDLWLYASDQTDFSGRIVFMISSDLTQLKDGEWCRISLPLSSGQIWGDPDLSKLTAYQIWVNDKGDQPVTVEIGPVLLDSMLTESAVALTFDDGWKSQIAEAAPIMKQYGLNGTAYIIPDLIGTDGYMDSEDLHRLKNEYGWTIGSHHMTPVDGLSREELQVLFESQRLWFENAGFEMNDFSYPNGRFSKTLLTVIPDFFRSARTIIEFPESLPPGNPYQMRILNIVPGTSPDLIEKRLSNMSDNGELLILVFHKIEKNSQFETELPVDRFEQICRILSESGIKSRNMDQLSPDLGIPPDPESEIWTKGTVFQPLSGVNPQSSEKQPEIAAVENPLAVTGPGRPGLAQGTRIDFSLDWRMVWGTQDTETTDGKKGDPRYYNQLDDLHLYLQSELSDTARLFSVAGIQDVNFDDFSKGAIDGTYFYLNSLFLEQELPADFLLQAGYMSPDPHHKWLQVTRSAGIESALGQDMTPQSLWLGAQWTGFKDFGIQAAAVPDFIGKKSDDTDLRYNTYQKDLGVPDLFGSLWYDTENLDAELAMAVNGSALKIASAGGYDYNFDPVRLSFSAGVKYTRGRDFSTYPEWDHLDDALRVSTGVSVNFPVLTFAVNPGLAFKTIHFDGTVRNELGFDVGIFYKSLECFFVLTDYDLSRTEWSDTIGIETGVSVDYSGVQYMAGYTMAGFNTVSGLYNNKEWNEGGVNGVFLRIKATYW